MVMKCIGLEIRAASVAGLLHPLQHADVRVWLIILWEATHFTNSAIGYQFTFPWLPRGHQNTGVRIKGLFES